MKKLAYILILVGGLNWGLVGFFGFDLVKAILGAGMAANVVYGLVGLSALWLALMWITGKCDSCKK